jgi:hypothetical protein
MKRVVWLAIGIAIGAVLGAPPTQGAIRDPRIVGGDGYLIGWDIIDANGESLCVEPYVWTSTHELECETE